MQTEGDSHIDPEMQNLIFLDQEEEFEENYD